MSWVEDMDRAMDEHPERFVTSPSNCPSCLAGKGGRHPDRGGTHPGANKLQEMSSWEWLHDVMSDPDAGKVGDRRRTGPLNRLRRWLNRLLFRRP